MRDPKAIRKTLAEIERIWIKHPHQRLGQLLMNASESEGTTDIFYTEDETLVANLKRFDKWLEEQNGSSEVAG